MIKKSIPLIFSLLQFLFLQNVFCQKQIDLTDYLREKFLRYCESVPREEIFVHTDRADYIAGEDLWFNIYLIDRKTFNPTNESKIAYFELLNPENQPVIQKRFRLDNGFGPGRIVLPDSLRTGTYLLRVYTNWMKNFMPYNCYMKDIKVYNAFNIKTFIERVTTPDSSGSRNINTAGVTTLISGLSLKANNLNADTLELSIAGNDYYRSANASLFYLFIQTHGIIDHVSSEIIEGEVTKIKIPKKSLTPGINQITLFDSKGQQVCEKFIYTPHKKHQEFLTFHLIDSCGTRNKISLEFEIDAGLSAASDGTNLSISVAPATYSESNPELNEYLIFGTEFGLVPWNKIRGRKISELPLEMMDSLLATANSNWIDWKTIFSEDPPYFRYQIENEEHYLTGTLLTSDQQLAHPGEFLTMSTPGKEAVFQYAITNFEASFNFGVHIDEELKDLIIQPDDTTKKNKIYIESSFSDKYLPAGLTNYSINKPLSSNISRWSIDYQINNIYESSFIDTLLKPIIFSPKPKRFYGKPDIQVIMKDFIKLSSMEEVFFELIPHTSLKNINSVYDISFVDLLGEKLYDKAPVLMIDGVIVKNPSVIANLDPELVEKIDVVREKYIVYDYLFHGLLNLITKTGDFSCTPLPDYAIRLKYRVLDPVKAFISPDYSTVEMKNSRIPDYRNTLFWNPSVKPSKDGIVKVDFWTSDISSDYEINITGITTNGKTLSLRKIIKVR